MGRTVDQISDHIESTREDLRSNLEDLAQKVKSAVDWREKFRANPGALLAVAFGGGFILASLVGGSRAPQENSHGAGQALALAGASGDRKGRMLKAWDDIQSALIGVVAAKVTSTLAEAIPGFSEQLVPREDGSRVFGEAEKH
jgi:hypothetical protein